MPRAILGSILTVLLVSASSFGQQPGSEVVGPPQPASAPTPELHTAPQAQRSNAPSEGQLTPPPEAERAQLPSGFQEIVNPAFPQPIAPVVEKPKKADIGPLYGVEELAPYFSTGVLLQAKAAFDAGRFAQAADLLKTAPDAPWVHYLRGLAALRANDPTTAAAMLTPLADTYRVMRDRCLTHAGIAQEELQHWDLAAQLFEQVPPSSKLYVDARFGLSRVRRHKRDFEGAMKALAPMALMPSPSWGRDVAAEALLQIADIARDIRDSEVEREALLVLWSSHPLSPLSNQAAKRLKGQKIPTENTVTRGEQLIEAHRNALGMAALEPLLHVLALPDPLACRAGFAYGKALRKERLHSRAIQVLQPVVDRCTDPDLRARALYVLGSSRSIVDPGHGAKTYELLVKDYPTHAFADDSLFYAADLYVRNGDPATAIKRLDELARLYPNGDFASEALFKTFWILRSQKRIPEALKTLERIEKQYANSDESYDLERARYWHARLLEDGGDPKSAADILEQLAVQHPATYYGLAARQHVAELDVTRMPRIQHALMSPPSTPPMKPLPSGTMSTDPHFLAGVELLRIGLMDGASTELISVDRLHQPPEALRLLVRTLAMAGDARGAHAIARSSLRRDLSGPITEENRAIWEVAYPNAFRDLIVKHCKAANLDPDLLQALMREESALDPKALSWAGALGLTQLMPSTANAVARANKLPHITTQMLLEPDWNVRLGALNLGSLLRRFKGVKPYAIAGYNAGDAAVSRWAAERPTLKLDEWIEEIPISETRGYVKRVLRSYNTYQLLYPLPVPANASASATP